MTIGENLGCGLESARESLDLIKIGQLEIIGQELRVDLWNHWIIHREFVTLDQKDFLFFFLSLFKLSVQSFLERGR